ncbi:MAG: hypothetical protein V7719_03890 [Psychroserpens sp.]
MGIIYIGHWLTLGFIREKDCSILNAVLLHAMFDMPPVFFSV